MDFPILATVYDLIVFFLHRCRHIRITAFHICLVACKICLFSLKCHINAPCNHRTVGKGSQGECHILFPELEFNEFVAEFGCPQHLVQTNNACPEDSSGGAVTSESVLVTLVSNHSVERKGIIRGILSEIAFITDSVCES